MSIVHVDKIWVEIAKKIEMRTSGGGGGVVSDFGHPRTRGGGGVKKGQIFADVLYGWPPSYHKYQYHIYNSWLTKGEREREREQRERASVASSLLTRSARDFLIGYSRTISSSYRPLINSWPTKGESQCSIHLVDEVT